MTQENQQFGDVELVMEAAKLFAEQLLANFGPDHPMAMVAAGRNAPTPTGEPGYGLLLFPPEQFAGPEQVFGAARAVLEKVEAVSYAMIMASWLKDPTTGDRVGEAATITVATPTVAWTAISQITRGGDTVAFAPWLDGERTTPENAGRAGALLIDAHLPPLH
jgi:hypothetical protein